jgi:Fe-S oxidoreductase
MLKPVLVTVLTIVALAIFARTMHRLWSLLRKGKPGFRLPSLGQAITDLLVVVLGQKKVLRWPYAGIFHIMIFWGFLVLFTTIVEMYGEAFQKNWVFPMIGGTWTMAFCQDLFAVLVLVGVVMAAFLRMCVRPKRFEGSDHKDAYVILSLITLVVVTLLCMHAEKIEQGLPYAQGFFAAKFVAAAVPSHMLATVAESAYWLHVCVILFFLNWIPRGKHLHLITIIPNILLRKHYVRGKLTSINLDDPSITSFGANQWPEFRQKELLDTFACMECGRCTAVCPANFTGKELNPKKLHTDIRYSAQKKSAAVLSGKEPFATLAGNVFSEDFFWQCTTCAACVEECPATNEHIDKIVEVRRYMVLSEGKLKPETKQALKSLETQYNPFSLSHEDRFAWARELSIPFVDEKPEVEYLYWVGCFGCFDQRNQKVTRAIVNVLQKAGVSFALLREERCTGDPARRVGNEDLYQTLAKKNIESLNTHKVKKIITQCPHCYNTLLNEYPEFGGHYQVVHHTQFLADLLAHKKISLPREVKEHLVYHDSCYLGRHNQIYAAPREVLQAIKGVSWHEMPRQGSKSFCCGGGGGRMFMEEKEGKRVNVERVEEAVRTKAGVLVSNCPYCLSMFEDGVKSVGAQETLRPKDLAEVVNEAMER